MGKGIFVIGTDTDVGKTFVTAGLTYKLKESGYNVIPFKPVQSGGVLEADNSLTPPDINYIKSIEDNNCKFTLDEYSKMNVYCLKEEVSPHLAARTENIKINKEKIINHYNKLINEYDYVIVEGAGGIVVPIIENEYFIYDLIKDLNLDVIIVARAGVGTINHTVLTHEFLKGRNIKVKGIIINNYSSKFYEDDNIDLIEKLTNLKVLAKINKINNFTKTNIQEEYKKLDLDEILKLFN